MSKYPTVRASLSLAAALALLSGCFGSSGTAVVESGSDVGRAHPVVEAFIEYPGPNAKWAGPAPFLLHVIAREEGLARVEILPEAFNSWQSAPAADARNLASAGATATEVGAQALTADAARENLANLEKALGAGEVEFRGCLSPVRARLVHADGKVTEKQGCRGISGWSKSVSDAANWFLASATHPSYIAALHSNRAAGVPAAHAAPPATSAGGAEPASTAPASARAPGMPVRNAKADSMAQTGKTDKSEAPEAVEPGHDDAPPAAHEGHGRVPAAADVGETPVQPVQDDSDH